MNEGFRIILFYKFVRIENPEKLRDEQRALAERLNLTGRMLIATEGINATFEGTASNIEAYKRALTENPLFSDIAFKESDGTGTAFPKLKIKVRPEVVTLGAGEFDVQKETATELTAEELEKWYANNEDFVVLDLRNEYEINSGYFEKTVHPGLENFRELPEKLPAISHLKNKKVVAVCTGGIRCEKATCLLKREGFEDLYQLKDGIHTYMEKYPAKHFKGSLFVFDNRMLTDVVQAPEREVVGVCEFCGTPSEDYYDDDTVAPSRLIICCNECAQTAGHRLRHTAGI